MEETVARPKPQISEVSRPYWEAAGRDRLLYQRCRDCGTIQFPFQTLCRNCLGGYLEQLQSRGRGKVYTFSTVHRAPSPAFQADVPYTVALVELDEGYRMTSSLVGVAPDDVEIGMPVEVVFDDLGDGIALPRFRPISGQ